MIKIKDLPKEERPREKALSLGIEHLSNAEILAIIISTGNKEKSALDLGYELLYQFGSIEGLASASILEIMEIKGINKAKGIRLLASFELLRRYEKIIRKEKRYIKSINDVLNLIIRRLIALKHEEMLLICLSSKDELIRVESLYKGTKDRINLSASEIISHVLKVGATKVYIAHNHPSDNIKPSKADIETFQTLSLFLGTCSIDLVDSLIIGTNESYSCAENKCYPNSWISKATLN